MQTPVADLQAKAGILGYQLDVDEHHYPESRVLRQRPRGTLLDQRWSQQIKTQSIAALGEGTK